MLDAAPRPHPAPACPQLPIPRLEEILPGAVSDLGADEDCLNLSVTAPQDARDLPVMVWIHGGSYESGAGDMAVFDPSALVAEQRVVVVSVTYRLGVFGFMSGDGRPGNLGAWDVISALRWVQRRIGSFGGDPARVTLFGQSSGGDLIARLMLASEAQGLFNGAIIQSAPLHLPLGTTAMRRALRRAAAGMTARDSLAKLLEAQARCRRSVRRFGLAGQMPFGPEFGLAPFPPENELDAAHRAAAPRYRVMLSHVRQEANLFLPPSTAPLARLAEPVRRAVVGGLTRRLYAHPARKFAERHRAAGGEVTGLEIEGLGGAWDAAHLCDLPLLFPHPDWLNTPMVPAGMTLDALRDAGAGLRAIWADFARGKMPKADLAGIMRRLT